MCAWAARMQASLALTAAQDVIEHAMVGASAGLLEDLSVHVCFICVLHLANEHALRITGVDNLDAMTIHSA